MNSFKNVTPTYIFDIDGTLTAPKWYTLSSIKMIPVNESIAQIAKVLHNDWYNVIIISWRSNKYREQIFEWMALNRIQFHRMFLKDECDTRLICDIKREIFENEILWKYNVIAAFENDTDVIRMYSVHWVQCLQVM